jgi:hypothetical protein
MLEPPLPTRYITSFPIGNQPAVPASCMLAAIAVELIFAEVL